MGCSCTLRKKILKKDISINNRDVYLDFNSTTKPDIRVLAEIDKINRNAWGNPSSQNSRGVNLYKIITKNIAKTLTLLNCESYNTYFDTSSTSLVEKLAQNLTNTQILTTTIDHQSLLRFSTINLKVDSNGKIIIKHLKKVLEGSCKNSVLIFSPVNHETGSVQPIKEIFKVSKSFCIPVIFDAVQTISRIDPKLWTKYCDGFYFSGHKIYSVQGAAILVIKKGIADFSTKDSTLPFSLYSGTFNSASVIGLLHGTQQLLNNFNNYIDELNVLHREALEILVKLGNNIQMESPDDAAPGIINISCPGIPNIEDILLHLSNDGIHISRLSSCTGNINDDSYILKEMGRDKSSYSKSLRISFGKGSKRDDFYRLTRSISSFFTSLN